MKILWPNVFLLAFVCLTLSGCSQQAAPISTLPAANPGVSAVDSFAQFDGKARPRSAVDPASVMLPVRVSGKWGYVNGGGQLVINPQFDEAGGFQEGRAPICFSTSCIPPGYTLEQKSSLTTFPDNSRWGFIDTSGKMVVTPQYGEVHGFSEGLAGVCSKPSSCGYIDGDGKVAIPMQFGDARSFSEGLAAVCVGKCKHKNDGKFGFIDHSGHFVVNPQYDDVEDFKSGVAKVTLGKGDDEKAGYIDKTGKTVWQPSN